MACLVTFSHVPRDLNGLGNNEARVMRFWREGESDRIRVSEMKCIYYPLEIEGLTLCHTLNGYGKIIGAIVHVFSREERL